MCSLLSAEKASEVNTPLTSAVFGARILFELEMSGRNERKVHSRKLHKQKMSNGSKVLNGSEFLRIFVVFEHAILCSEKRRRRSSGNRGRYLLFCAMKGSVSKDSYLKERCAIVISIKQDRLN